MSAPIKVVGVIGAGQMGVGIAQVCASAGYRVLLHDVDTQRITAGLGRVGDNLARQLSRGTLDARQVSETVLRLEPAQDVAQLGAADLVIEAAAESEAVKNAIFQALLPHLGENALLATNTSSISITRLATRSGVAARFIGLHFMNPPPVMKLVEVISGIGTAPSTYARAVEFVGSLGKTVVNAEDFPAFLVNRILITMINEAIYALHEGVGTIDAIDTAMKQGANQPMGPLALGDFIGLDTVLAIMNVLHAGLADSKYRPCPLLVKYVEAGWLGKKTGRGFYDYSGPSPVSTR